MPYVQLNNKKVRDVAKITRDYYEKCLKEKYFKIQGKKIWKVLLISKGKGLYSQLVLFDEINRCPVILDPSRDRLKFALYNAIQEYFGFKPTKHFIKEFCQQASEAYWGGDDPETGEEIVRRKMLREDIKWTYEEFAKKYGEFKDY